MLFNSLDFLIFFPAICYLYFLAPTKYQQIILFIGSCIFYMAFIPYYVLILFLVIIIDYLAAIFMERVKEPQRKLVLLVSIAANLSLLQQ